MNRGIARRPLFESSGDMRFFLARLAFQVRIGRVEVHAFSLMTTHFYLLLRSPRGELSEAMRRIQNAYSRRFNRQHKRDGSLIRGRFQSKPVKSHRYRCVLISYIDHNPVVAKMVSYPNQYPFGSASAYARETGPIWLERSWVESNACRQVGACSFNPGVYRAAFGAGKGQSSAEQRQWVKQRIACSGEDPLDNLVAMAPAQVQAWMIRKARLADGHRPDLSVCLRVTLERALATDTQTNGTWRVEDGRQARRGEDLALTVLMRQFCGSTWQEIAHALGGSRSQAIHQGAHADRLLIANPSFAHRTALVGHAIVSELNQRAAIKGGA